MYRLNNRYIWGKMHEQFISLYNFIVSLSTVTGSTSVCSDDFTQSLTK